MDWLTDLRLSLAFRRKVRAAGLRIVGTGTLPVDAIHIWREDHGGAMTFPVRQSPHCALLRQHLNGGIRFCVEDAGMHPFRRSGYYRWHVSLRGYQHARPDEWIEAMARRLIRLHDDIKAHGYRCRCVADRIAVLEDNRLWDGGHRLACLAILGWATVPVVRLRQR